MHGEAQARLPRSSSAAAEPLAAPAQPDLGSRDEEDVHLGEMADLRDAALLEVDAAVDGSGFDLEVALDELLCDHLEESEHETSDVEGTIEQVAPGAASSSSVVAEVTGGEHGASSSSSVVAEHRAEEPDAVADAAAALVVVEAPCLRNPRGH